jgi:hypothetical protein
MPGRGEGALEVDLDHRVPLRLAHVGEHAVTEDAGVVDQDVEPAEGLDGGRDEPLGAVPVADVIGVGDGLAAHGLDLVHDVLGRALVVALPVHRATEVVDDDLGAVVGQQQRVLASDAPSRTRDDGDAALAQLGHA